mgnify:CR=1 FL=1
MANDNGQSESIRIAHLTMLQGVISRMGANSFTLKALSATFGSAAVAVTATADKPSLYYATAAIVPILIFWLMDAQFLRRIVMVGQLLLHCDTGFLRACNILDIQRRPQWR